jgi:hypothetical protein
MTKWTMPVRQSVNGYAAERELEREREWERARETEGG